MIDECLGKVPVVIVFAGHLQDPASARLVQNLNTVFPAFGELRVQLLIVVPERMSAWKLYKYLQHLSDNRQKTERYEIALWKKLFYPLATLVMMALALPFAYMQARAGMVGVKVFLGIMLGVFFHMLNNLFSHIGLLQNWAPLVSAVMPSIAFLAAAMAMMWWVERR